MQIAVACMVRNEADIFASFVNHTAQFVDTFYIADHQSNDGTSELLARLEALSGACGVSTHGYNMVSTQYFQRETCRCLADLAFRDGHDWVIFLDADEFLLQGSRPELEAALEECLDGVAAFEWRNLIPSSTVRVGPFQLSQPYTEPVIRRNPPKQKIAISRDFVRRFPFYRLKEGNHGIELAPDYRSFGEV